MDITRATNLLSHLNPRLAATAEKYLTSIPYVQAKLEKEYGRLMAGMEDAVKPYRGTVPTYERIPPAGREREGIVTEMEELARAEQAKWRDGFVSGAVYQGDDDHIAFLNRVYALASQVNPLHSDLWPSVAKYEAEIVSMTAHMLGADAVRVLDPQREEICGVVSSGGTESIMLAMKTYRDWARLTKRIRRPELVVPTSAHVAFDKAARYFGIKLVKVPVAEDHRADVTATIGAITKHTIALVGSAPSFPHGVIDPIEALSGLARARGIGFHTDACLGGFVLPWAERLGYPVPPFDFRLPGVTSMSADTHKFGYAAKGTSVVLYRGRELRSYQYFTATEWPGGLYFSPTLAGSRPGGLSAACWAAMVSIGESGYLDATRRILETAKTIKQGVASIPELRVLGDPLFVVAFASSSKAVDIYKVLDLMTKRGWSLNGLHKPPAVHICVTLRHAQPGVAERFVDDLRASVAQVRADPKMKGGMAPVYGLAATVPFRGLVSELLKRYMDLLYKV